MTQSWHEKTAWLSGHKYRLARVVLLVVACVLMALALFMLSFTSDNSSRVQQVSTELIQPEQKAEVLLVASYDDGDVPTRMQRDGALDVLNRSSVAVDVEYLDRDDANDPYASGAEVLNSAWGQAIVSKVRAHGTYDCVLCVDDDALAFVEAAHEVLFAQTPVVFIGVNDIAHANRIYNAGYATGLVEGYDIASMMQTAKEMRPEATRIVAITDNTATGVGDRAQFQQAVAQADTNSIHAVSIEDAASEPADIMSVTNAPTTSSANASTASLAFDGLPVTFLNASSLSRADLGQELSTIGNDAIVVYLDARSDSSATSYSAAETAYFVSQAIDQPVFCVGGIGVGEGFAGANVIDYGQTGARAAEMVVSVLNGTRPADIPLEQEQNTGTVFDSKVLAAYQIPSTALPSSANVINQSGISLDSLRPIFLPIVLLVLGIVCIILFTLMGYRRSVADMAEIVIQRNTLERQFYTDHLTEMPNMQWLTAYASDKSSQKVRSIVEVALLDMEKADSTHGAGTSNEVVKTIAARLDGLNTVFLVRPGRFEFILGIDRELKPGGTILDELEYLLSQPITVHNNVITMNSCIGVYNRERGMSIEEMVAGVDIAIRQAEQLGMTDDIIFYDSDMRQAVEDKIEITSLLNRSIEREDFVVMYQPQVELATNEVVGYEALVRLKGDAYPPERFIPVAEMTGQIIEIDRIVSKKVVEQLARWKKRKQRMRPVSINYSAVQLRDEHYIDFLVGLLDEWGLSHALVRLDVRENLFITNMAKATELVESLRAVDIEVAIDGFGSGYTSISRVMKIPADVVKIDRSVTAAFLAGGDDGVVGNLVRLVHSANKIVVIEGVETEEQLQMCLMMGCDVAQGFFFSPPILPERAVRYAPAPLPEPVLMSKLAADDPAPGGDSAVLLATAGSESDAVSAPIVEKPGMASTSATAKTSVSAPAPVEASTSAPATSPISAPTTGLETAPVVTLEQAQTPGTELSTPTTNANTPS